MATKDQPAIKPTHDEVAKEAYSLSQKDGRPKVIAKENWLEAEAQLQNAGSDDAEHHAHSQHSEPQAHQEHEGHQGHPDHHAHMVADFRKRFYISLVLTLPILVLSPLLQSLVGTRDAVRFSGDSYVLLGFSSAVFWYGGWPFLKGLVDEIKSLRPGMMILVAVAISTA